MLTSQHKTWMLICWFLSGGMATAVEFTGSVVDADSGKPLDARVYLQNESGDWLFVESATPDGSSRVDLARCLDAQFA